MDRFTFDMRLKIAKHGQIILLALLGVSLLVNFILVVRQDQKVILMPGTMTQDYHITQGQYDEGYLADASATIANLFLNSTPATVDWRKEQLLRWVHPASFQNIAARLDEEARRIKAQKLTTSLAISTIDATASNGGAESMVVGVLTRFVAGRKFRQGEVEITITWSRDGRGAALIRSLTWQEKQQ